MIYLQNSKESQDLRIPRSLPTPANVTLFFVVMNTITKQEDGVQVEDLSSSDKYYLFRLKFAEGFLVDSGEYEYKVMAGADTILAQGLLHILDTKDTKQVVIEQYDDATIEIEQYGRTE